MTVRLEDVKRPIDLQHSSVREVRDALQMDSEAVRRLRDSADKLYDFADLAHVTGGNEQRLGTLANRLQLDWPSTPITALSGATDEESARLHDAHIESAQQLWRIGQAPGGLERAAEASGIQLLRLQELVNVADATRVSRSGEGVTASNNSGCLPLLLSFIWRIFGKRTGFKRSKTYRMLFRRSAD
jgi:hypothetical protein